MAVVRWFDYTYTDFSNYGCSEACVLIKPLGPQNTVVVAVDSWSLFRGHFCYVYKLQIGAQNIGRCMQVVSIWRWSLDTGLAARTLKTHTKTESGNLGFDKKSRQC